MCIRDSKQTDRYLSMLDSYLSFKEEFPESKYTKEVDRMAKHCLLYTSKQSRRKTKPARHWIRTV